MAEELKPCPFCRATVPYMESAYQDRMHGEALVYNVQCQQCCAAGPSRDSYHEAAEAWGDLAGADARAEARAHAEVIIADLRARLKHAEFRVKVATDDYADAESEGRSRGAAECLTSAERAMDDASRWLDDASRRPVAPSATVLAYRRGRLAMARDLRRTLEVTAHPVYRPPTPEQNERDTYRARQAVLSAHTTIARRLADAEQRAEAAEAEVVRLQTERAWAQVDACLMLALAWALDAPGLIGTCAANDMSAAEIEALRGLCERTIAGRSGDLPAAILRAIHNEGTAVRGSAACVAAVVAGLPATAAKEGT